MHKANCSHCIYSKYSNVELILCSNSAISYPLHNHVSVFTIGMVLDGSISLDAECSSHVYSKNHTFIIPPYMPHRIKANNTYSLISLCINKDLLTSPNCNMDKIKTDIINLTHYTSVSHMLTDKQIVQLLDCIYSINCKHFGLNPTSPFINNLKQLIEQFPENKLSIEEMALSVFTSKFYFLRSFKQEIGLTPHQFQLQNQIRKAQRLMSSTATMAEVAMTTGFCDQSHFIRQFKKLVGLTPTNYKMSCSVFNPYDHC